MTLGMLGDCSAPCLNAKAKETEGLLLFCTELLQEHKHKFLACGELNMWITETLLASGLAAVAFSNKLNDITEWPAVPERQFLLHQVMRHLLLA